MLNKDKEKTEQVIFLSMDDLVPKYHLFIKTEIDSRSFISLQHIRCLILPR